MLNIPNQVAKESAKEVPKVTRIGIENIKEALKDFIAYEIEDGTYYTGLMKLIKDSNDNKKWVQHG